MTAAIDRQVLLGSAQPLAPVTATLRAMFGTSTQLPGLAPDLLVPDPTGWMPTAELAGAQLDTLLDSARRRWNAQPHAAAALAWKAYTYWLALPAVLGWAAARRVPLLTADDVLMHFDDPRPLVTVGLRADIPVAVLASDPLALVGLPQVRVVADEAALLAVLRSSLLDQHLSPLLDAIHGKVRLGARTLLGSLASGRRVRGAALGRRPAGLVDRDDRRAAHRPGRGGSDRAGARPHRQARRPAQDVLPGLHAATTQGLQRLLHQAIVRMWSSLSF